MADKAPDEIKKEIAATTMDEFLESTPPNQLINISDLAVYKYMNNTKYIVLKTPEIQLHCDHQSCNGIRFFRCVEGDKTVLNTDFEFIYITYLCSNCQKTNKIFSLAAKLSIEDKPQGQCLKFGEMPTYGPPVSPKLIKLIGPDREEFLKGRRCENQGLGVGAFIYYRRTVENQKNRIIEEIIRVSEKISAPQAKLDQLRASLNEKQFSKAWELAKDAIPESLLINGHSPILLLHDALSEGVHSLTDEDCLELARDVRIVLGELAERLSQALKDEAELTKALGGLMNRKKLQ